MTASKSVALLLAIAFSFCAAQAQEQPPAVNSLQLGVLSGYNFSQKDPLIGSFVNYQRNLGSKWAVMGGLGWDYSRIKVFDSYHQIERKIDFHEFDINLGARYYFHRFNINTTITPLAMGDVFFPEIKKSVKALPVDFGIGYQLRSKSGKGPEIFIQSMGVAEFKLVAGIRYNLGL